jgi:hypothetical protein
MPSGCHPFGSAIVLGHAGFPSANTDGLAINEPTSVATANAQPLLHPVILLLCMTHLLSL